MDDVHESRVEPVGHSSDNPSFSSVPFRLRFNTWPVQRSGDASGHEAEHDAAYEGNPNFGFGCCGEMVAQVRDSSSELTLPSASILTSVPAGSTLVSPSAPTKKHFATKNASGKVTYADMIAQAIRNSPDQRLTLSQIYEWIVGNVPAYRDKGNNNSGVQWKNSVRHNLSLHPCFVRVENEEAGKSSWWMINPDANADKSTRRRAASMGSGQYQNRRDRAKKNVDEHESLRASPGPLRTYRSSSSIYGSTEHLWSNVGQSVSEQQSPVPARKAGDTEGFRTRTSSDASSRSRLSPLDEWARASSNHASHFPWASTEPESGSLSEGRYQDEVEAVELNKLAHLLRLQDGRTADHRSTSFPGNPPPWNNRSPSTAPGYHGAKSGPWQQDWRKIPAVASAENGFILSPVRINVFTGGTCSSVPNPSMGPILPNFATCPVASSTRTQQRPGVFLYSPPSHFSTPVASEDQTSGQLGGFPADLEQFVGTDQSAFEVDVDEVLRHELKLEGNLDCSFDYLGPAMAASVVPEPISGQRGAWTDAPSGPETAPPRYRLFPA